MEIHNHPHHSGHKKAFTEYLSEFFMIFMAVTAGFFAETFREHLADSKKEKEYIISLVSDLKQDTSFINRTSKVIIKNTRGEDSLIQLLNNYTKNDSINKKAYKLYFTYTTGVPQVLFNDRTMNQLLSSGNMRLIDHEISDSIIFYDFITKGVKIQANYYNQQFKTCFDLSTNIFDFTIVSTPLQDDYTVIQTKNLIHQYKLLTSEKMSMKKYCTNLTMLEIISEGYVYNLRSANQQAARLITLLKRHYNL